MINYLIAGTIILFTKLYYLNDRKIVDNILKLTNIKITDNLKNENIKLKINNNNFYKKVVSRGELGLAESYMDGDWETNNLELFLKELIENQDKIESKIYNINFIFLKLKNYLINSFKVKNKRGEVDKNVSNHYDIGNDLYSKMLDKNMQYTCAYFDKDYETLNEAQLSKMKLIAKKLNLKEGMEVLDIGCGFGGLANYLANNYNVKVTGVSLSQKQIDMYNEKFKNDNVNIIYSDYRDINGSYDRVYSIGMFEHVGRKNYQEYYDKCYDLLKDDGIMLLHTIGTNFQGGVSPFINKYIFPEAELPHLSDLNTTDILKKWHLEDIQNFGISYSKTLRKWHNNIKNWNSLDNYDIRFRRMWEFYLLSCSASFSIKKLYLFQLIYTKDKNKTFDCYYIRK
tara:strand:- start:73 stop:1266 length:1194 start_codon:yes stop_codon:yes gene_type:complete